MNERIKELYLQAHTARHYDRDPALDGNPPTVYWQGEVSAQRFAELIVRECISCLNDGAKQAGDVRTTVGTVEKTLKQHFGLET